MERTEDRMFDLISELEAIYEDGIPIFPGRIIVNAKNLYRVLHAFPNAVTEEIEHARKINAREEMIIQDAKIQADRILKDTENERMRILDASNMKKTLEEEATKYRQNVIDECQQEIYRTKKEVEQMQVVAQNEALKIKEDSQIYAQQLLNKIEQDLHSLYQIVKNNQQQLQQMRQADSLRQM